ncbi:hypothetical protein NIA69_07015 [Gemmiger formicilis]|nr:hypothetical protein [Gemmiger formicilis]
MLTYNMDVEERSTWLRATPARRRWHSRFTAPRPATFMAAPILPQPVPIRKAICCFIRCPAPV